MPRLGRSPDLFGLLTGVLLFAGAPAQADPPLGRAPTYTARKLSEVPNVAAIVRRIWVPGLDEGYVPQGLTYIDGTLFVGTYLSTDAKQSRGPCRLFRLDPESGAVTGQLDLPPSCGHAGGLARGPRGVLYVADTRLVIEIALGPKGAPEIGRVTRTLPLTGDVRGSFAAGSADALWLGTYAKEGVAKLYRFPFTHLGISQNERDAADAIPLPLLGQGAAFDGQGRLWVARSGSKMGELVMLNTATGAVEATYAMPAGLEDLSFDERGWLWTLSEAGSRRWLGWETFYPVIFALDPTKLVATR